MGYEAITAAEVQVGKPVQPVMVKVKDNFDYFYSQSTGLPQVPLNGSFEIDADEDGIPDNWTRSLYPGGSGGLYTAAPAHGAKAAYFTHPGGGGNGGGYLDSDYLEVSQLQTLALFYILWATAAGMKNQVYVRYYTAAKAYISETALYSSTSNPTSATLYCTQFTPPSTARYIKIRVIGGYTDTDVAGTAYYDGLLMVPVVITDLIESQAITQSKIEDQAVTQSKLGNYAAGDVILAASDSEVSNNSTSYIKVKEIYMPRGGTLRIKFDLKTNSSWAYGRIYRNGAAVGTERSTASGSYVTFSEDISGWTVGDYVQLYIHTYNPSYAVDAQNFRIYSSFSNVPQVIT